MLHPIPQIFSPLYLAWLRYNPRMLEIVTLVLGPVETNTYLVADSVSGEAVCIDPAWDGEGILAEAQRRSWRVTGIWLTHAHFDHMGGVAALANGSSPVLPVALHPLDGPLWQQRGGAVWFGLEIDPGPEPMLDLYHGQLLNAGEHLFKVRHAPGHTPGHVIFYCAAQRVAFTGDVIFQGNIGRSDFPGGDYDTLMESIHQQVLTLPAATRLLSGHGPETSVRVEQRSNPFLG